MNTLACAKLSTPIMPKISVSPLDSMNSSRPYTTPFSSETVVSSSMRECPESDVHPPYFGRSILHVVGKAVALPSTLASLFHPRPESSTSYFVFFNSVDTYSGCSSW